MDLVYYTVGYSSVYIDVLALSIKSLRAFGYEGDIAVLCDESFLKSCKEHIGSNVRYKTFPDSRTPEQASMNKLRIFELPDIEKYKRVLFLDSDILVHMDSSTLFQRITTPGVLYVYTETTKQDDHQNLMWSLQDYSSAELIDFQNHGVHVFNAGCFAFVRDDTMKDHFLSIQYRVMQHVGRFFYEQSFMNAYFNRNGQTDRTLFTHENYAFPPERGVEYPDHLVHFAGDPGSGYTKLQRMKEYSQAYLGI